MREGQRVGEGAVERGYWLGATYGLNHPRLTDTTGLRPPGQAERTSARGQPDETRRPTAAS